MKYLKTMQEVPGKGFAHMYYELNDDMSISRYLTHIDGTGETTLTPNPVVKKLFRPEMLSAATKEEFDKYWAMGE
jgi:hypothetical protein